MYYLLLAVTVAVSYGQTLWMDVWRDMHAIFFKFTHLNELTGYLGLGIFGGGPYRFSVTPYYFVYKLVGYSHIWPYYLLNLIFYFLATLVVYKLFSTLINDRCGKLAGFLFAAGYIGTEGFMDLAGSMILNVSIILLCLCLICYHTYYSHHSWRWYLLALAMYILAIYITPVRSHYFIGVIFIFDLLWLPKKTLLIRFIPYIAAFYFAYLRVTDTRTPLIGQFVKDVLVGKFYQLYSFFGSFGNLFLPDKYIHLLVTYPRLKITEFIIALGILVLVHLFTKKLRLAKTRLFFSIGLSIVWAFLYQCIVSSPQVTISTYTSLAVFLGGIFLVILVDLIIATGFEVRRVIILLTGWICLNLLTYAAYDPLSIVGSVDRYIAHSFIPLVGLIALVGLRKGLYWLVVLWGLLSLFNCFVYQQNILKNRSFPSKDFYTKLKQFVPVISKGDILYFDVADNARSRFEAAFTVGQMPDETAIAWKYGLDRYDFQRLTEPTDLATHTFFYSLEGLKDTTTEYKRLATISSYQPLLFTQDDLTLIPSQPVSALHPISFRLSLKADPVDPAKLSFPITQTATLVANPVASNPKLRKMAFDYLASKKALNSRQKITANSIWRDNPLTSISDDNLDTAWRADRFDWAKNHLATITIDLGTPLNINRLVWYNAYPGHTPTSYSISKSTDGQKWDVVKTIDRTTRIEANVIQTEEFPTITTRFVRMDIRTTLTDDSPGVSEIYVVPSLFSELNISQAEQFLSYPLGFVPTPEDLRLTLELMRSIQKVDLFWWDDHSNSWQTSPASRLFVAYDGKQHTYSAVLPVRGSEVLKLKLVNPSLLGQLHPISIEYKYLSLDGK